MTNDLPPLMSQYKLDVTESPHRKLPCSARMRGCSQGGGV